MDSRQVLFTLSGIPGPSGFETPVAAKAVQLLEPLMDEVYLDRFGNAVGIRRCGRPGARRVLLDAHLDEIGLIITGIEEGFLRFQAIGGVDPRMLPNRELTILTRPPLFGVVSCLPPHIQSKEETDKTTPISELFIDVGMSQAEAEACVPIGTPAVFRGDCFSLGTSQVCGKAMDDRSCFTALLRTAELLRGKTLDVDLIILGSTREEVSGAGARTAVFALEPDCCVAVDVTHGKTPDASAKDRGFDLGRGPAVGVGPGMTRWMSDRMIDMAKKHSIPHHIEVMSGHTGTNGWHMQTVREGIATAVVSLPLKYMHSPVETLDMSDLESLAALLAAFVTDLGEKGAFAIC